MGRTLSAPTEPRLGRARAATAASIGARGFVLLAVAAVGLALSAALLSAYLDGQARHAVDDLLERRIEAVGATAARLLGERSLEGEDASAAGRALADLAATSELDGAYVFDGGFVVRADAHGEAGRSANLLRLDPDRSRAALAGRPSVGWAFDLDGLRFLGGYFPMASPVGGAPRALAVEAGERFTAPARRLRAATLAAFTVEGTLALLALATLLLAVRAARREREAYGRAERAALASRMAATVAHEVRNPLGIIRGGAELLRERIAGDDDRELVDDILGEVERLNGIVEQFLDLAREPPLRTAPFDVGQLARELAARLERSLTPPARVVVTVAAGDTGRVIADEDRLRRALLNLVLNALQAAGPAGQVHIEVTRDRGAVCVIVSDDGPGIAPTIAARLFEPFNTGRAGGTGLGLAVARRIVEQHGGTLTLAPSVRGARFVASLPVSRSASRTDLDSAP